jgi:hypothetical protein
VWGTIRNNGTKSADWGKLVRGAPIESRNLNKRLERKNYGCQKKRNIRERICGADESNAKYGSSDLKHGRNEGQDKKEENLEKEIQEVASQGLIPGCTSCGPMHEFYSHPPRRLPSREGA